jgi:hypothetical protein
MDQVALSVCRVRSYMDKLGELQMQNPAQYQGGF